LCAPSRQTGRPLPPRAVLVTFDDGYQSVKELAVPILERFDVPAVIFACSGPPQKRNLLWFDALERRGRANEVEPAKSLSYREWRHLLETTAVSAAANDERALMIPEEIAWCARHPLIEIGAHTVDHPILAKADAAVQREQIGESVATLEAWTGRRVQTFAYPNGRAGLDFNSETVQIIKDLALDWAFSTESRMARADGAPTAVPRFTMLDSITEAHLAQYLSLTWPRTS
jgi:peptidoglycan/xylan/chitin deacetylase (PgdA/CDA1 family)